MKKNKIFIACDSTNISKIKEIIKKSKTSKLKIGYSLYNLQNWKLARLAFDNVISNYPNSTHSVLAEKKIQGMNLEGR